MRLLRISNAAGTRKTAIACRLLKESRIKAADDGTRTRVTITARSPTFTVGRLVMNTTGPMRRQEHASRNRQSAALIRCAIRLAATLETARVAAAVVLAHARNLRHAGGYHQTTSFVRRVSRRVECKLRSTALRGFQLATQLAAGSLRPTSKDDGPARRRPQR